jgi:hypothetical protein
MVDAELGQFRQPVDMRPERRGIGIDFGVPARDRVDAGCQCCDVIDAVDPAAEQIEAHGAHAERIEFGDLRVRAIVRDLRHADPAGTELRQDVHKVGLIVGLE